MVSMSERNLVLAAAAAYFYGRGYYVNTDVTVSGCETVVVDLVAVMPRMKELKIRLKRGFAPTGIINHLHQNEWTSLNQLIDQTRYEAEFIAAVMHDAVADNWVESKLDDGEIFYRIKDYRVPARECLAIFEGMEHLSVKIDLVKSLEGCFHRIFFVFPFSIDDETMDRLAAIGGGVMKFYRKQGVFQEILPGESFAIEDNPRHASLVETVLYENVWLMNQELI